MRGKKIKEIDPFEGAISTIYAMKTSFLGGSVRDEDNVFRTEENDWLVDTCVAFDTDTWETGINRHGKWTIVEQYEDKEESKRGHNKWVKKMRKNPECNLEDIHVWGIV